MFGRYLVYDTHRQFNYTIVYSYINGYNLELPLASLLAGF